MHYFSSNQVSVTFFNRLSADVSHTLLYENDEIFSELMNSGLQVQRDGFDIMLFVSTETELYKVRRITQIPLFIKF
ncbi:hypothetical protein I5M27_13210 [Adhaeribacter sp. BT258]|uniref:Uncharacterized protein n=1 Tax=Adhaeribacter terrigena TaxID=2793070 RepID=A0ABS1C3G7_9BACT|nr:hypothetical protein [Adhaeribacter terrigena]MBK0403947.1 hypothetical protein [Adhaeribacter terrigena]